MTTSKRRPPEQLSFDDHEHRELLRIRRRSAEHKAVLLAGLCKARAAAVPPSRRRKVV